MNTGTKRNRAGAILDLRRLSHRRPSPVEWRAGEGELTALAARLDLLSAASVVMRGEIRPEGAQDFLLEARLSAHVAQACVATLTPVAAVVETVVLRRYLAGLSLPEGGEHEMPEDDTIEPLPDRIDLAEIAAEALSLALPDYPRATPPATEEPAAAPAVSGDGVAETRPNRPFARLAERLASPPDGTEPEAGAEDAG